jgi:hypothetical protein
LITRNTSICYHLAIPAILAAISGSVGVTDHMTVKMTASFGHAVQSGGSGSLRVLTPSLGLNVRLSPYSVAGLTSATATNQLEAFAPAVVCRPPCPVAVRPYRPAAKRPRALSLGCGNPTLQADQPNRRSIVVFESCDLFAISKPFTRTCSFSCGQALRPVTLPKTRQ